MRPSVAVALEVVVGEAADAAASRGRRRDCQTMRAAAAAAVGVGAVAPLARRLLVLLLLLLRLRADAPRVFGSGIIAAVIVIGVRALLLGVPGAQALVLSRSQTRTDACDDKVDPDDASMCDLRSESKCRQICWA
jgi:hypothetical protein